MEEDYVMIPGTGTKKIIRDVKKEIETAFLDYSMSVIVSRALPDVRDGLKPVHRRILFTMHERGNDPAHPYRKSADTVGAVLGSYHPHGDASVYDAMVRLAQDFSMRYPLVDGQGNFGSVDGDPPAAYRYTEARMSRMAVEMLTDIDKDTVDWDPNYDDTKKEPQVLPCRFPNLLVNGSQGIAVGMATNIPPHNLGEVIDGCIAYIDNPDIDLAGLMEYIKGPDFPTAGIIMGRSGIRAAYATGRGKITLRGRAVIEEKKNGRFQIVVTEIPYMVNKARLIENIAELVKDKRVDGISDLNDETNRKGMRIVIGLRRDANPQVVLNQLYRYTQLQDTVGVNMLAIDHKVPKVLTLKQMIAKYVEFQDEVIRRRTSYDLKKAQERAHILEGLKKATDIVDELIATIRACKGGMAEAKAAIMERFGFDDPQADAIVKLQLGRLAGLEILKIEEELSGLRAKIEDWQGVLADDSRVLSIVKEGTAGDPAPLCRPPPHRDRDGHRRGGHRGPDHRGAVRLHPDRGRLRQAPAQGHLPGPAPGRPGHPGHDPQGRGHRPGDVRGLHPRLCPVRHRPGPAVPHQGLHHRRGQPHQQGGPHRQPAAAGRRRKGHQYAAPVCQG